MLILQGGSSSAQDSATAIPQRALTPTIPEDVELGKVQLYQDYEALRSRAKKLLRETTLLRDLTEQHVESTAISNSSSVMNVLGSIFSINRKKDESITSRFEKHIPDLVALANGRVSTVVRVRQPGSVRSVARTMEGKPDEAVDIAVTDLEDMARWLASPATQSSPLDNDAVREALVKRVQTLVATLSDELKPHASTALMHIEHEVLRRTYVCKETMYGDPVADIPRSHFLVTEDGYPWDMEELAGAISSNGGVMRNPLSRQLFSTKDVRAIVSHPLGKRLAAMQVEQSKLKQGVRPKTIEQLDKMAAVLLADQSSDQMQSRHVVDEFATYMATLPFPEQKALDELRVPATDSHTGLPFDTSIGEAVRDAQGNRVCFHKTGDLIRQAVSHLKSRR